MPHPPQELPYRSAEYGDFVLSVGRLDRAKRVELLLEAVALDDVAGRPSSSATGPSRQRLEGLANERVRFAGRVSEQELADLYATCRRRVLRAGGRGFRHGAVRGVPRREARRDDERRRRAARGRRTTAAPAWSSSPSRPRSRARFASCSADGAKARSARRGRPGRDGSRRLGRRDRETARMKLRDRVRGCCCSRRGVAIPLALLGVFLVLASPVVVLVPSGGSPFRRHRRSGRSRLRAAHALPRSRSSTAHRSAWSAGCSGGARHASAGRRARRPAPRASGAGRARGTPRRAAARARRGDLGR